MPNLLFLYFGYRRINREEKRNGLEDGQRHGCCYRCISQEKKFPNVSICFPDVINPSSQWRKKCRFHQTQPPRNLYVSSGDGAKAKGNWRILRCSRPSMDRGGRKGEATNNVQANPCGSRSGVSMEVEEIAQPTTFKHYRYSRTGIIKVSASAFSLYFLKKFTIN